MRKIYRKADGDQMPQAPNKDWKKELFKPCWDQDASFKQIKGGWVILHPDGDGRVTVHMTNSDHRALKNTVANARQAGFNV
ncbi:MAG: hypothetical protein AB7G37_01015 [Solirubrobacteraceae bacterium]